VILLPHRDVPRVRHLFGAEHLALVIDAIIAGNTPASVWADDAGAPRMAMVWERAHNLYVVGALNHGGACREIFGQEIAPAGRGIVKVHAADAAACAVVTGHALDRRERVLYRGDGSAIAGWPQRIPLGFRISSIDEQFRELGALSNFGDVVAEIESCWTSVADFRRAGFGFCAHDTDTIVCWCTAEYVSDGRCGIGIETVPAFRRRGFATVTARPFVEHCARHGIVPHWDAWSSYVPSVAVAEKLGFRRIESYSVSVGSFGRAR
jgi:GNAT superfamily N-acetyltransferase